MNRTKVSCQEDSSSRMLQRELFPFWGLLCFLIHRVSCAHQKEHLRVANGDALTHAEEVVKELATLLAKGDVTEVVEMAARVIVGALAPVPVEKIVLVDAKAIVGECLDKLLLLSNCYRL